MVTSRSRDAILHQFKRSLAKGGLAEDRPHYRNARLPLSSIVVLPQPRQTFEGLEELAEDIADKGILNPLTVAQFDAESFTRYLAVINQLWRTSHQVANFPPHRVGQRSFYYVLLAGERRYRAARLLWEHGCQACQAAGRQKAGTCFRHHFGQRLEVRLCENINALPALFLQLSENTHLRVPEHEEARAYQQLFQLIREVDQRYPVARFARKVGRSPSTIQRALRFCDLPIDIQNMVEDGLIRYGLAIEIARLQSFGLPEEQLRWWASRAMVKRYPVPEYRQLVSQHLHHLQVGQQSLFAIMADVEAAERRNHLRRVVAVETIQALWGCLSYVQTLLRLYERGALDTTNSPFSLRSPRRVLRSFLATLQQLDPHLNHLLGGPKADELRAATTSIEQYLEALELVTPHISTSSEATE